MTPSPWNSWLQHLRHPQAGWVLLGLPALLVIWWRSRKQRRRNVQRFLSARQELHLPARRWLGRLLILATLAGLVAALAGPWWGMETLTPQRQAHDLLILVDVSQSMLAEDPPPLNRLQRAQRLLGKIADLAQLAGGNLRIGIGVFAGKARLLCPPTEDLAHVRTVISNLSTQSLGHIGRLTDSNSPAGTSFQNAVNLIRDWVKTHATDGPFCDFLLVTDGGDVAQDFEAAALESAPYTLHVLGIGDNRQAWPIPIDRGYLQYTEPSSGSTQRVLTRRNDTLMQAWAARSGGMLLLEENVSRDLPIWWQSRLLTAASRPLAQHSHQVPSDRSQWFLGMAVAFLIGELAWGGAWQRTW